MKLGFIIDPHLTQAAPSSRVDDYGEAMLSKIRSCAQVFHNYGVDYCYVTGDVFNSKNITFEYFNRVVEAFMEFKIPVGTILGNHDLFFDREDTLHRTPLGTLLRTGILARLGSDHYTDLTGRRVNVFGCDYKAAIHAPVPGELNILVAHSSYGDCWGEKGLNDSDLAGYQIAVLGHDHATHVIEPTSTGCVLVRPGSISRGTAGEVDRTRIPQVAVLDLVTGTAQYIVIPHAPADQVFSQQEVARNEMKTEVKDYVKSLSSEVTATSTETVVGLVQTMIEDLAVRKRTVDHLTKAGIL